MFVIPLLRAVVYPETWRFGLIHGFESGFAITFPIGPLPIGVRHDVARVELLSKGVQQFAESANHLYALFMAKAKQFERPIVLRPIVHLPAATEDSDGD